MNFRSEAPAVGGNTIALRGVVERILGDCQSLAHTMIAVTLERASDSKPADSSAVSFLMSHIVGFTIDIGSWAQILRTPLRVPFPAQVTQITSCS